MPPLAHLVPRAIFVIPPSTHARLEPTTVVQVLKRPPIVSHARQAHTAQQVRPLLNPVQVALIPPPLVPVSAWIVEQATIVTLHPSGEWLAGLVPILMPLEPRMILGVWVAQLVLIVRQHRPVTQLVHQVPTPLL